MLNRRDFLKGVLIAAATPALAKLPEVKIEPLSTHHFRFKLNQIDTQFKTGLVSFMEAQHGNTAWFVKEARQFSHPDYFAYLLQMEVDVYEDVDKQQIAKKLADSIFDWITSADG